ncbi:PTS sugar transporter subunit IIA [Azospirillum rugosum]|uniref:PTS system nitrogen regulatory IIA component n=1 Tax=Azospirillum rugosum TaxID=416170 RepID=A0ABS4SKH2_9PROT|nr:PTS sugar transporter subunit IIA [Azospirillum rugosum]MBP2292977.1 PTS system nitrogen regulatory IIA component [Azospirillum rugosum]MDQ0526526.1 PTS system nitrogen regulatory IIA component [Azospirillum rugosum]
MQRTSRRLLSELAGHAAAATSLPQSTVLEALEKREALGSAGVGSGVALPHARVPGIGRFFGLFARLERHITNDAVDDQPVDLVFLLLGPPRAAHEHLHALACVSRRLRDPTVLAHLRRSVDAAALYSAMAGGGDC